MSEETIINGIDVSEEIRYCNNCSNLGLDFKAGKFYCSLSHRPDELPEVLSCDEFSTNCYIKRLQEENEELKKQLCETKQFLEDDSEESSKFCQKIEAYQLSENEAKEIIAELEQENKELRQIRKNSPDIQDPYVYLYRQIKKQCHKLEKENKSLQMLSCANCGEKYLSPDGSELYEKNVQLQEENEELKKRQITKNGFICDCEQNAKYKRVFEEIREITNECITDCMGSKCEAMEEIQNKIDEVLK